MNPGSDVYVVKYNLDGNYLMSGHADRTVKLWNPNKGTLIKSYEALHNREVFDLTMYFFNQVSYFYRFRDNARFASCGGDKIFYVWDVLSGKYIRKIVAHQSRINTLSLNMQENVIATGSFDNTVKIWDLMSPQWKPI